MDNSILFNINYIVFILSITTLIPTFSILLGLMFLNQLLYTVPPIRLKDTVLAPFSSTATNSVLRMASCAVLLGNIYIPVSVYLFIYTASMGTYIMYKSRQTAASVLTFNIWCYNSLRTYCRGYEFNTVWSGCFTCILCDYSIISQPFYT